MRRRGLAASALLLLVAGLALLVKHRYGGGGDFPDRSTAPQQDAATLQTVAELPTPPGNIAVSASGRIFISLHPEAHPDTRLIEWVDGRAVPYPNLAFQQPGGTEPRAFVNLLGIRIDRQNRLWTLDNGNHGRRPPRLLAFDLASNAVVHQKVFDYRVAGLGSHLNDLQVAPDGRTVYLADASILALTPALLVYEPATHRVRRVLEGHRSVRAEFYTPLVDGRRMELFGLFSIRPGVDSIALDERGEWLYFGAVTGLNLYRVRTADLRDATLAPEELAKRVELFAGKSVSDGLAMDRAGNIYVTDPEHGAIQRLGPDGRLRTWIRDPQKLRWPDGLSFGPDGMLYVTASSLQTVLGRRPSSIAEHAPYGVYRFRPAAPGTPGH